MIEIVVPHLSYSAIVNSSVIIVFFTVLILLLTGLMLLSLSNSVSSNSWKTILTPAGVSFISFTGLVVIGSIFMVPSYAHNELREKEVENANLITEELTKESGSSFLVVDETEHIRDYLLSGNMTCMSNSTNDDAMVFLVDEKNTLIDQMTLNFTVNTESNTCVYSLS